MFAKRISLSKSVDAYDKAEASVPSSLNASNSIFNDYSLVNFNSESRCALEKDVRLWLAT